MKKTGNRLFPGTFSVMLILLLASFIIPAPEQNPEQLYFESESCTSVIVGKNASADGSTMTSHSCDSGTDRTWMTLVPRKKHKAGSDAPVFLGPKETTGPNDPEVITAGFIKQVPETYAYINTAYPVINEYQLAIGETTFGGKRELQSNEGILDCPELYRLALERAKTAREAIKVIDELTKEYGYNDVGECFTFADKNETWHFEILGPGRGKKGAVWAAVRIPDDEVGVSANASRIRQIDIKDTENYMASANVFSLAQELGFWDPQSGEPFEFCYAYASRTSMGCRRREWRALSMAAPSLRLDPNAENYPLSVKPDKKLSVKDVLNIFRDYYGGTPYDMTQTITVADREGKMVKSPIANPFMSTELRTFLKIPSERTIACARATYVTVTQSRNWLPDAVGGVVWLGYDNPTTTPHIPFYCGITTMPASYMVDGRAGYRADCAWWTYRKISQLSGLRYQEMVKDVSAVWSAIEDKAFADQKGFEDQVVAIIKSNPEKAAEMLTKYSVDMANSAEARYKKLEEELWTKHTRYF